MSKYVYEAPDQYIRESIDFMGMKLHCYDPNVRTNNEPVFELIDTDNVGLGVRTYFDIVKQVEDLMENWTEPEDDENSLGDK